MDVYECVCVLEGVCVRDMPMYFPVPWLFIPSRDL